jgi:hypothetical protein
LVDRPAVRAGAIKARFCGKGFTAFQAGPWPLFRRGFWLLRSPLPVITCRAKSFDGFGFNVAM